MMQRFFRVKDLADALRIPPRWISQQMERQLIPCARPGSGALRELTRVDAYKIALMRHLTELGTQPVKASKIAGDYFHARGLLVITAGGDARVQDLSQGGASIPGSAIVINLDQLRRDVDARLPIAA